MTNSTQSDVNDPAARSPGTQTESPFGPTEERPVDALEQSQLAVETAKEWVRENQTVAMIGAFAFGAFVGAMMRD